MNQNVDHQSQINVVKKFYAALNGNDIPVALQFFSEDIIRTEWEGLPSEGTFRGLSELKEHFIKGRSTWAEGGCNPQEFFTSGNKVVVLVHVRVRLKDKTEWNEGPVIDGFNFNQGKITHFNSYIDKQKAFAWASQSTDN